MPICRIRIISEVLVDSDSPIDVATITPKLSIDGCNLVSPVTSEVVVAVADMSKFKSTDKVTMREFMLAENLPEGFANYCRTYASSKETVRFWRYNLREYNNIPDIDDGE